MAPSDSSRVTDHDEGSNLMDHSSGVELLTDTPVSEPDDYGYQSNQDYSDDNDNSSNSSSDDDDPDSLFVSDTKHGQNKSNFHSGDAAEESDQSSDYGLQSTKKQKTSRRGGSRAVNKSKVDANKVPRDAVKGKEDYKYRIGYNSGNPPLSTVREWFADLTRNIHGRGFPKLVHHLDGRALRVGTMCSGTESPILALNHVSQGLLKEFSLNFKVEHVFSAEIVPFKQAFIERNFKPPIIFRDVTELSEPLQDGTNVRTATTAYGGKAIVPGDLDLLVAGFVCSDYSHLNNLPKVIEDRGESGDTFYAIKDYCREYKPKMVILENVISIPWTAEKAKKSKKGTERGLDSHFEDIGYTSRHVILDTKNYYVPQTRQRGYLIAIHRESFPGTDVELDRKLKIWMHLLKDKGNMRREASVPAECLLLKSDDPKLKFSHVEDPDQKKKPTEWERCKRGHESYRLNLKLGPEHPVTNWAAGGFKQLPDYYKPFRGATERVLDTVDISHLRSTLRGFDNQFWNRNLELSQNVYRITDGTLTGLMPCITPTGFPFITTRGGGITGHESLLFQALDAESLDTVNFSQNELRNMAGNAMTSTVVGAVIVTSLTIFRGILNPGTGAEVNDPGLLPDLKTGDELQLLGCNTAGYRKVSVRKAIKWASESRRLCYCEGRAELATNPLQQCIDCGHTTCTNCGKRPKHNYSHKDNSLPTSRMLPFTFEQKFMERIPMSIRFNFDKSSQLVVELMLKMIQNCPEGIDEDTWASTVEAIEKALSSDVYFREIRRAESWHVHFSSPLVEGLGSRLELVISDHSAEWLLYATVPSTEPLNSKRRQFLEKFPCARMRPCGDDLVKGIWELYMPELKLVDAVIKGKGKLVDSYKVKIGLEEVTKTRVWDKCSVELLSESDAELFDRDITGDYEHSRGCGQAYDSLHVQVASKGTVSPVFLLFDHEKSLRDPLLDSFIFTDDIRRLEYREYRNAFGRLDPNFHPSGSTAPEIDVTSLSKTADTSPLKSDATSTPGAEETSTSRGEDSSIAYDDESSTPQTDDGSTPKTEVSSALQGDDNATPRGEESSKPQVDDSSATNPTIGLTVLLDEASKERNVVIYRDGHWLFCRELSMNPLNHYNLEYFHLHVKNSDPQVKSLNLSKINCHSQRAIFCCKAEDICSISNRWVRGAWTELSKCSEQAFFKEFRWLLEHERVIFDHCGDRSKWQPTFAPKHLCYSCSPDTPKLLWTYTESNKQAPFEDPTDACNYEHAIKARPLALSIRYLIDSNHNMQVQVGMDPATLVHRAWGQLALTGNTKNIEVAWRLITDNDPLSKPVFDALALLNSEDEVPAPQPQGVTRHPLRNEQLRNLAWAVNQERFPKPFIEEAIAEDRITYLNYRSEGKATREVTVPGGVLAHEVGFGKTLVMLGLIDSQSNWDEQHSSDEVEGRISVKATVVFCPPHLANQWYSESKKFLPSIPKDGVLCINTFQKLKGLTIGQFQKAKLIIVNWNIVEGEAYTLAQAQFAGMVEPDTGVSDRAFRSWYSRALEKIGQNVEELKARPATFGTHLSNEFDQDKATTQSTHAVIPSKRVTGSAYKNKSSNSSGKGTSKRKLPSKVPTLKERADIFNLGALAGDYSAAKCPLFELFSFARVIHDEYTYLRDGMKQVATVLESIGARHRWLLSGTPAMSGFSDIKEMAKLIGVNLGPHDYTLMKSDVLSRERKSMTRSEEFLTYRDAPSAAWQENRHIHAQAFLDHFVRKDIAKIGKIPKEEKLILIEHPAAAKAAYHELMQFLTDTGFDLGKRLRSNHHKAKLIHDALYQCQDAEEALILRAASAYSDLVNGASLSHDKLCEQIIETRMQNYLTKKEELEQAFRQARWLCANDETSAGFFETFRINVKGNRLGDLETSNDIEQLLCQIEKEDPVKPPCILDGREDIPTLRQTSILLGTLFANLIDTRRSWRFAQAVQDIRYAMLGNNVLECSKCGNQDHHIDDFILLGQCGHLVCSHCVPGEYESCQPSTCLAGNSHYNKVSALDLLTGEHAGVASNSGKIDDMVHLIKHVIPHDEKVLVFVQFPKLLKKVQGALKDHRIDFCDLGTAVGSWKVLSQFQKAGNGSKKVMILNIGDASAAGSNLTMANHVIFVSPYHTKGSNAQYTYDAAMTQAIGRARRFGQQKTVHVYHFLVQDTADIDIVELRTSRAVLQINIGEGAFSRTGGREESKYGTPFYNHISRDFN